MLLVYHLVTLIAKVIALSSSSIALTKAVKPLGLTAQEKADV